MDFSRLNKSSSDAFNQQKNLLKRVLSGKVKKCESCGKELHIKPIETGFHLYCALGCTDVKLDTQ